MTLTQPYALSVDLLRRMHMPTDRDSAPVEILLIEDSSDDADLMARALKAGSMNLRVTVVEDGEEAMNYLRRKGPFATAPEPDLILLDLHLPRMTGHEVLAEIKEDASLRRLPIVIMTSSVDENDFQIAYELHANCCVSKPTDHEEFTLAVQKIEAFWRRVARHA